MDSFKTTAEPVNGLLISGKYFPCDWISELIDIISDVVLEKHSEILQQQAGEFRKAATNDAEINYTVVEVATMVKKSPATVARHIRLKLLKATKIGKSWNITAADYKKYRFNEAIT